jgi:predicted nucleic acid-binding protein
MAKDTPRRYWDSDAFIGWLAEEHDKVAECAMVLAAADAGKLTIVTSSLTLAEVIKLKHHTPIASDSRETIRRFFLRSYIVVVGVTRFIAEDARDLVWDQGINPKDAIHVATALYAEVPRLETFDEGLIKKDGKIGEPPLDIGRPIPLPVGVPKHHSPGQGELDYAAEERRLRGARGLAEGAGSSAEWAFLAAAPPVDFRPPARTPRLAARPGSPRRSPRRAGIRLPRRAGRTC